ncbi:MAG: VOC family protein [Verrucomicrobia bacterium]|nr:VOC family protein [Verrucomicrobiota bacterium]
MRNQPEQNTVKGRIGSINHLRLTVTDIPTAERFYSPLMRFMGYELSGREKDRLAWVKRSGSGVFWLILSAARRDREPARHDLLSPGFHHLAWNADDRDQVDELYRLLVESGATVLDAPAEYDYEPGYYAVFFTDPDGMKLEFVHVPERLRSI